MKIFRLIIKFTLFLIKFPGYLIIDLVSFFITRISKIFSTISAVLKSTLKSFSFPKKSKKENLKKNKKEKKYKKSTNVSSKPIIPFRSFFVSIFKYLINKVTTISAVIKKYSTNFLKKHVLITGTLVIYIVTIKNSVITYLKSHKRIVTKVIPVPLPPKKIIQNISETKKLRGPLYFILGLIAGLIFITLPLETYLWFRELPKAELLVIEGNKKPTRILDKNGKLLYEIYVDRKYDPISLKQLPKHVINATLAVEDSEFYNHIGIRPDRILKAAQMTLLEGEKQGASTITQQLVKNVLLTPERTFSRKVKELVLTFFVEAKYTKDEILELYLNNISYGGVAWGIQSASQKYFGKNVWELNLAESSMLAGLPSSPSTFSPLIDLTLAKQRQLHVLNRMNEQGYITKTELLSAYEEKLTFAEQRDYIRAPHFVHYVRNELELMYGKRTVEYGGLTVTTTLDLDLQEKMESIVKDEVAKSKNLNLTNGAAVVLDVKNSGILGYVGSVDYFKEGWGAFDVASAYRQPGSSIKPVTFALALEKSFTPASIIRDEKISYPMVGGPAYSPVNYDGRYHGNVTLRSALANSYNIPAVKLAQSVGPDNIVSLGNKMGLKNWEVDGSYGLAITLGGKEVKLLDHSNVYATFAREGIHKDLTSFTSIKDSKGYEIYEDKRVGTQVLSKEVSYLIWDILSDNNARLPAFGTNNTLTIKDYKVAVKTGTTDNKRDNWTMGFTPSYTVGVWVGNNDNVPMNQYLASGLTGAAPIWSKIMQEVLSSKSNEIFAMPDNVFKKYDKECNRSELFIKGSNVPATLCPPKEEKKDEKDKDKDKDKDKKDD